MPLNHCTEPQAPTSATDQILYTTREPGWMQGIRGEVRPVDPGSDSGVLAAITLLLVLVGLNMKHVKRLFSTISADLWSVRRRSNLFDNHTSKETRTILILLLQLFLFEGILLYLNFSRRGAEPQQEIMLPVALLGAVMMGLYLFQLLMCMLIGYVFTDKAEAVQWRRGQNAVSVLLGMALLLPTLAALFYPSVTAAMLILAAVLYIISRIIYIIKGFRIFYINFPSLLYFILYLCSVEIVPLVAAYSIAMEICRRF
ncbi:MAG: DUF4271 domain-containing protein [Muribaculaceae bacterium]|nr:DUF4271 domain-containing protein [Bacteroidales bacterium]MDY4811920.1 DUF4271 domain-containing protein [Muribaculaceae bacterium]